MKIAINVTTGAVSRLDDIVWMESEEVGKKSLTNSEVIALARTKGRRVIPVAHPYNGRPMIEMTKM
jgi:hypothetical protein